MEKTFDKDKNIHIAQKNNGKCKKMTKDLFYCSGKPTKLSTSKTLYFEEKWVIHQVIHNIHMWTSGKNVEKKVSSSNICFVVSDKNRIWNRKKWKYTWQYNLVKKRENCR